MPNSENPFSSPSVEASVIEVQVSDATPQKIVPTTQNRRFVNLVLDSICIQIAIQGCGFCIGIIVGIYAVVTHDESVLEIFESPIFALLGLLVSFLYYFLLEGIWGRTLGKLATGTKVVGEQGLPLSWGQVLGRTLCRYIPFDALSYLSSGPPRGWHDSISKTYVVRIKP